MGMPGMRYRPPLWAIVGTFLGAIGFAACLALLSSGMRAIMATGTGSRVRDRAASLVRLRAVAARVCRCSDASMRGARNGWWLRWGMPAAVRARYTLPPL